MTLDEAVNEIHRQFDEANKSDRRGESCRVRAGKMLIALRIRIESGEAGEGVKWWEWYEGNFVRSRKDAEKVMALATSPDPEASVEQARASAREGMRRNRGIKSPANVSGRKDSQSDEEVNEDKSGDEERNEIVEGEEKDPVDQVIDLIIVLGLNEGQLSTLIERLKEI